jgi:hypothetical protein
VFESVVYPYSLTTYKPLKTQTRFIPETLLSPWHPAERAWDGEERFDLPHVDRVLNSHCHEDHVAGNGRFRDVPWHLHAADLLGIRSLDDQIRQARDPAARRPAARPAADRIHRSRDRAAAEMRTGDRVHGRGLVCDGFGFALWVAAPPSKWNAAVPLIAEHTRGNAMSRNRSDAPAGRQSPRHRCLADS